MITYYELTHHVVPGPQSFSYIVPHLLLPVALLIPRTILSRWQNASFFMAIFTACTIHAWWKMRGVDVISVDRLLWSLFLLVLKDPWSKFRYVTQACRETDRVAEYAEVATGLPAVDGTGDVDEQTTLVRADDDGKLAEATRLSRDVRKQAYPATLRDRLPWVGTLLVSIRLNNWKIGSPSHDRTQPPMPAFSSRKSFIAYTLLCFIRGYLTLDLTRAYISHDPYYVDPSISITSPLPLHGLRFIPPQLLRTMIVGAEAWALVGQMFYLPCLLPVGLHALGLLPDDWSPHLWPAYYGSPREIFRHGVRGFWGQYWHQTMRWSVSAPGYALADALRLRPGSMPKYGLITIVAFGLSGTIHMGLVPPEPLSATMPVNRIRLCVAGFFWAQAIGVLCEVTFARCIVAVSGLQYWQAGAGLRLRQAINGIWVVTWFALSLPLVAEFARQLGYWTYWTVPVSIWTGLMTAQWIAWPCLTG